MLNYSLILDRDETAVETTTATTTRKKKERKKDKEERKEGSSSNGRSKSKSRRGRRKGKESQSSQSKTIKHSSSDPDLDPVLDRSEQIRQQRLQNIDKRGFVVFTVLFILTAISFHLNQNAISPFRNELKPQETFDGAESLRGRKFFALKQILSKYSSETDLKDVHSPQFRALDWIANRDKFRKTLGDPLLVQRYVLAVLYYSTNGEEWTNQKKWLSDLHECEWSDDGGVRQCDDMKRVIDMSLWNNLKGTIPTEIGLLSHIKTLYLSRNKLVGTIPTELGKLAQLEYLGLQHNKLQGTVPAMQLGELRKLKFLHLEKNDLTGFIRRVEPICKLRKRKEGEEQVENDDGEGGVLEYLTADCRSLVEWKDPEIVCACCTTCYLP